MNKKRHVPAADPDCGAAKRCTDLLDDLGRDGEHAGWNGKTECLGGLEIDHEFELGGLLDRQVGGFFALDYPENASGVPPHSAGAAWA